MDEQDTHGRGNQMTREEMIALALESGFNDKQIDAMFYESGPYDISFPTTALESFYRAAFAAGQTEMRERVLNLIEQSGNTAHTPMCRSLAFIDAADAVRAIQIEGESK